MKTLTICMMLFTSVCLAQPGDRRENVEAMKIAFITKELQLTPAESEKFWPVYNQYDNQLKELRKAKRSNRKEVDMTAASDKELEERLMDEFSFRQKELDLSKEYYQKFKSVLPTKKAVALYKAEEEFKRELLRRIQNKHR